MGGGMWMQSGEAGQPRAFVVQHRVVLHGTGAERIELQRLGEVELRQPQEMAQHLRLAHLGHPGQAVAAQLRANQIRGRAAAKLARRQIDAAPSGNRLLENQRHQRMGDVGVRLIFVRLYGCHPDPPDFARPRHPQTPLLNASQSRSISAGWFISVAQITIVPSSSG